MILYTLLSHDCRLLPYQVAMARKFLPDLTRIVAIVGPHPTEQKRDDHGIRSAGALRLDPDAATRLGIETLDAPETLLGRLPGARLPALVAFALGQSTEDRICIHGDLLPVVPMTIDGLLNGRGVAARVYPGTAWPTLTWVAVKAGVVYQSPLVDFAGYGATRRAEDRMEDCEPGWLHVDKISISHWTAETLAMFETKLAIVAGMASDLTVDAFDPCGFSERIPSSGSVLRTVAHGAAGIAKAVVRIDRASDADIAARKAICAGCEHAVMRFGVFQQCKICGCATAAKIRNAKESCPLPVPKWTSVDPIRRDAPETFNPLRRR